MTGTNRRILLASRPSGLVTEENLTIDDTAAVPEPGVPV